MFWVTDMEMLTILVKCELWSLDVFFVCKGNMEITFTRTKWKQYHLVLLVEWRRWLTYAKVFSVLITHGTETGLGRVPKYLEFQYTHPATRSAQTSTTQQGTYWHVIKTRVAKHGQFPYFLIFHDSYTRHKLVTKNTKTKKEYLSRMKRTNNHTKNDSSVSDIVYY